MFNKQANTSRVCDLFSAAVVLFLFFFFGGGGFLLYLF